MRAIIKARALFKKAGLAFPVLPKKLAAELKEEGEWHYSTLRKDDRCPYFINAYINEDDKTKIGDYAVVAHSGYGANSYAIQYYLVYGPLRMFLFLGWGGVYGDRKKDANQIKECFGLADRITKAASEKLRPDSCLTVVVSDFSGNYWSPHDKSGALIYRQHSSTTDRSDLLREKKPQEILRGDLSSEKTPQQVLGEVLDWLDGIKVSRNETTEGAMTNKKFKQFYINVMNCDCGKSECSQSVKNNWGWVPRGFSTLNSNRAKILVVGKNPGHPFPEEIDFYGGKRGENLLNAKKKWDSCKYDKQQRQEKDKSLKYHMNLKRYLRYLLGQSKELEVYKDYQKNYTPNHEKEVSEYVAFTNLFKCSTKNEREKIKDDSFEKCYEKYFKEEIKLIRPQVILALGKEVEKFLKNKDLKLQVIYIKHPSYFYSKNDELNKLRKIKKELESILNH